MPPEEPNLKLPVFVNATVFVIVPLVPRSCKLYPCAAVVNVGVTKAPLNKIVAPLDVLARTTLVPVVTAPLNVAPFELATVNVRSDVEVPICPDTAIVPPVPELIVKDCVLAVVPLIELLNTISFPADEAPVEAIVIEFAKVTAPV